MNSLDGLYHLVIIKAGTLHSCYWAGVISCVLYSIFANIESPGEVSLSSFWREDLEFESKPTHLVKNLLGYQN